MKEVLRIFFKFCLFQKAYRELFPNKKLAIYK